MRKVAVIGAGPSGMMAAIAAAEEGARVTLYEKNEKCGKKLYITGKGRCNLTNTCGLPAFFDNIVRGRKFLYSAVYSFSNEDTRIFFEEEGVPLKEERGGRVFPASDKSSDIIRALTKKLEKTGVELLLNREIKKLSDIDADAVIIATGGLSYQSTGSTGDGYIFAEEAGHRVNKPAPSLVPLVCSEEDISELEGLSLRNVKAVLEKDKKRLYEGFGEMLFTSEGVSGPLILTASSIVSRDIDADAAGYRLHIDLKPALDEKQLDTRVLRDFSAMQNKCFKNSLAKLLPSKLIPYIVKRSGIDPDKKVNEIRKEERKRLVGLMKDVSFTPVGTAGFNAAVITSGGVELKEINSKTMRSKIDERIYFAGEVIDADAFTGGFNLQIAFSTGMAAGRAAAKGE